MKIIIRQGHKKSWIWSTHEPFSIGQSEKYIFESRGSDIWVRKITKILDRTYSDVTQVSLKGIQGWIQICLNGKDTGFSVRSVNDVSAFASQSHVWVSDAVAFDNTHLKTEDGFKKRLIQSMVGMSAVLALFTIYSNQRLQDQMKDEAVVPTQVVKMIASLPTRAASSSAGAGSAQKVAVAQKSIRQAVSQLKHGGLTGLFKGHSTLLSQMTNSSEKKGFSGSRTLSSVTSSDTSTLSTQGTQVASLGGGGGVGGVGYGNGSDAKVQGQGHGFVSLDYGNSAVEDGLSKEEVGRVIHSHMAEIRYCYEASILKNPNAEGKLMVDFTIVASGDVSRSSVKETTIADGNLNQCILSRLDRWKFPKPKGGVKVAVTYPFIFKTLGK